MLLDFHPHAKLADATWDFVMRSYLCKELVNRRKENNVDFREEVQIIKDIKYLIGRTGEN